MRRVMPVVPLPNPIKGSMKSILRPVRLLGPVGLIALGVGCQYDDRTPPPPLALPVYRVDAAPPRYLPKPLPEPTRDELPPPPFEDGPIVTQRITEARAFVDAYNMVGRPRIVVFVNRTLEGDVIPSTPAGDVRTRTEHVQRSPFGVSRETTETVLRPGEYDEVAARSVDYAALEAKLAEWLSADGQVRVVSPSVVREKLTDEEIRRLQQGRPRQLADVAKNLNADILVQVQARPTRQTPQGLEIRLIAEAVNIGPTQTGESIGHVVARVQPPLDSETINGATRFVARKLMMDMANAWIAPGPGEPGTAPPAGTAPAPGSTTPPPRAAPRQTDGVPGPSSSIDIGPVREAPPGPALPPFPQDRPPLPERPGAFLERENTTPYPAAPPAAPAPIAPAPVTPAPIAPDPALTPAPAPVEPPLLPATRPDAEPPK